MPEQPIYFIRHNFNGIDESITDLKNNGLIGFHFADEFFERKEEYTKIHAGFERGFSRAYDAFARLGQSGGIAVFEYNDPDVFYVAMVDGRQTIRRFDFEHSEEGLLVYKVLSYHSLRRFNYADHPVLLAIRPPYSTICQPQQHYQQIIRYLYLGRQLERTVNLLHPTVLEQLCENYLRSEFVPSVHRIHYTIMKTGKTLPVVDIIGRSVTGQKLFVQVTHYSGGPSIEKAKQLIKISHDVPDSTAIFFSADSALTLDGLDTHYNIADVFDTFNNSLEPWHQNMIKEMIGVNLNDNRP